VAPRIHLRHLRAALQRFAPVLTQLYSQGESPMTISALPVWAHKNHDDEALQSAGFVRSGVEVRILDADGAVAPHEEVGEIAVRGDVVMWGYWRNDDANAASLSDGWLKTGDIGRFDARGHLHILDRQHDMIISGGSNIYSREVEDILTRHPAVSEAIVLGLPDPEWGENVASAIVLREGYVDVDADTLIAFCREHLGSFKKPKRMSLSPSSRRKLTEKFCAGICAIGSILDVEKTTLRPNRSKDSDGGSPVGCKGMWSFDTCPCVCRWWLRSRITSVSEISSSSAWMATFNASHLSR
jgi:acyl-CoA synthetase (AMP-forming)/AMP-acid ligase II